MKQEDCLDQALAGASGRRIDRRTVLKRSIAFGLSAPLAAALLAACGGDDDDDEDNSSETAVEPDATSTESQADEGTATTANEPTEESTDEDGIPYDEGNQGGVLRVILSLEPPTLDMPFTNQNVVGMVVWNVFEPLYSYSDNFELVPMLAESVPESSDDLLTHTITLRQGVQFHDGGEMTAADVIASINRWMNISGFAAPLVDRNPEIVEVDTYTIEISVDRPLGVLPHLLAMNNGACPITPASVVEAAGDEMITDEFIGTGPYRFVEWQPDRFIRLERFEDYSALPGEPNGYGGHKYAFVDEIVFTPVSDEASRVTSMLAGDFDHVRDVSGDQFETLEGASNVSTHMLPLPWSHLSLALNMANPPLDDPLLRQAVQAAINAEEAIIASTGAGFYVLEPSILPEGTPFHSTAGQELFHQDDPERAQELLDEAGYDGTPLIVMSSQSTESQATVVAQQLENAGFTIDLRIVDSAARLEMIESGEFHVTPGGYGFKPDPTQIPITQVCDYRARWCDYPESGELIDQLYEELDFEARYGIWEQFQQNYYEQVPYVHLGHDLRFGTWNSNLRGPTLATALGIPFWNMWFDS